MNKTYDFVVYAQRDEDLMRQIRESMESGATAELCTTIHRLKFSGERQSVTVEPVSDSAVGYNIEPTEIRYRTLTKMLEGRYKDLDAEDILDIR